MRNTILFLGFLLPFLISCTEENQKPDVQIYFDLQEFIVTQVQLLDSLQPDVQKTVLYEKKKETQTLKISNWKKELKMFSKANINRPGFKDLYQAKDSSSHSKQFKVYHAQRSDLKVRTLRVEMDKNQQIKSVEAWVTNQNMLYESKQHLSFTCTTEETSGVRIESYSINGFQKTLFGTHTVYDVEVFIED